MEHCYSSQAKYYLISTPSVYELILSVADTRLIRTQAVQETRNIVTKLVIIHTNFQEFINIAYNLSLNIMFIKMKVTRPNKFPYILLSNS